MADPKAGGGAPIKPGELIRWFFSVAFGFWLLWIFSGGPARYEAKMGIFDRPFLTPIEDIGGQSNAYGESPIKNSAPVKINISLGGDSSGGGSENVPAAGTAKPSSGQGFLSDWFGSGSKSGGTDTSSQKTSEAAQDTKPATAGSPESGTLSWFAPLSRWFGSGDNDKDDDSDTALKIDGSSADGTVVASGGANVSAKKSFSLERFQDEKGRLYLKINYPKENVGSLDLTGYKVRNMFGGEVTVGRAVPTFRQGVTNQNFDVVLSPGGGAILIDDESPIGVSFLPNRCFGYLAKFQEFRPSVGNDCPTYAEDPQFAPECVPVVKDVSRCKTITDVDYEATVASCGAYLVKTRNYNGCLNGFADTKRFYGPWWRLYMPGIGRVLGGSGVFRLVDGTGKTILYTYLQ